MTTALHRSISMEPRQWHASIQDDQLGLQNTQREIVFPINGYKGCSLIYRNYALVPSQKHGFEWQACWFCKTTSEIEWHRNAVSSVSIGPLHCPSGQISWGTKEIAFIIIMLELQWWNLIAVTSSGLWLECEITYDLFILCHLTCISFSKPWRTWS